MRRVCWRRGEPGAGEKEWLVTNGLGGYASGTVAGPPTRRFHGALIAATPRGRILAVSELQDDAGGLEEFALEDGLPVWRYAKLEKRILLPQGRNLTLVWWRAREPVRLQARPWFQVRPHEGRVDQPARACPVAIEGRVCEIDGGSSLPILMAVSKGEWRALPPETRVHPGHTDPTTIGAEWEENVFIRLWRGVDPAGDDPCTVNGRAGTLELFAPDYDGGHKGLVRWEDGTRDVVPGSRVVKGAPL